MIFILTQNLNDIIKDYHECILNYPLDIFKWVNIIKGQLQLLNNSNLFIKLIKQTSSIINYYIKNHNKSLNNKIMIYRKNHPNLKYFINEICLLKNKHKPFIKTSNTNKIYHIIQFSTFSKINFPISNKII